MKTKWWKRLTSGDRSNAEALEERIRVCMTDKINEYRFEIEGKCQDAIRDHLAEAADSMVEQIVYDMVGKRLQATVTRLIFSNDYDQAFDDIARQALRAALKEFEYED